jgi:flagellar basal body-associated protein FliL
VSLIAFLFIFFIFYIIAQSGCLKYLVGCLFWIIAFVVVTILCIVAWIYMVFTSPDQKKPEPKNEVRSKPTQISKPKVLASSKPFQTSESFPNQLAVKTILALKYNVDGNHLRSSDIEILKREKPVWINTQGRNTKAFPIKADLFVQNQDGKPIKKVGFSNDKQILLIHLNPQNQWEYRTVSEKTLKILQSARP